MELRAGLAHAVGLRLRSDPCASADERSPTACERPLTGPVPITSVSSLCQGMRGVNRASLICMSEVHRRAAHSSLPDYTSPKT